MCVCVYIYIYIYTHIDMCIYTYICVCVYIYIYIYMYIYISLYRKEKSLMQQSKMLTVISFRITQYLFLYFYFSIFQFFYTKHTFFVWEGKAILKREKYFYGNSSLSNGTKTFRKHTGLATLSDYQLCPQHHETLYFSSNFISLWWGSS